MADEAKTKPRTREERWRLVLGEPAEQPLGVELRGDDLRIDEALSRLYDEGERKGGLGRSTPWVARWLGDIRTYVPASVVRVMQKDALERLKLQQMLLEPELLASVEADVHLVATLLSLRSVMPERTKQTAREVVRKVVAELERRLREPMQRAVKGALSRAIRNVRPKAAEIDWDRTIRKNLKNWLPERRTIVAERPVGHGRRQTALRDVILCVDQSGSMAPSVVYAGIFGAVLASIRSVSTQMVVFDTNVVDLTADLQDPVELLFGTQLGGGTDIARALAYCEGLVRRPEQTVFVLITDLYEGGDRAQMLKRAAGLVAAGVRVVCLLALNDQGAPVYDHENAAAFAALGIPAFACTPDRFPELMAAALSRQDLGLWASRHQIATAASTR